MAGLEAHADLLEHPKVLNLAGLIGWDVDTTIGKLLRFWWWCQRYCEDGDLRRYNDETLGRAVGLNGEAATGFVRAMASAGWLDRKPYFRVHDWWNYIGRFLQGKYKQTPARWRRVRDLYQGPDDADAADEYNRSNNGSNTGCNNGSKAQDKQTDIPIPPLSPPRGGAGFPSAFDQGRKGSGQRAGRAGRNWR